MADARVQVNITADASDWDPREWGRVVGYADASYEWETGHVAHTPRPAWIMGEELVDRYDAGHADGFDEFYAEKGM